MLEYLSNTCRVSSSGRATASQAVGGGFESRILLQDLLPYIPYGRPKGRSCGAFCFYRPPGGVFFVLASLYFYLDLYPPGCGALFLLRGTGPACKKQTAAPAPPRLFLPQAAARLRSPPPFYRSPPCRCAAVLLRLTDFCGAGRSPLAKTGALLRVAVAQICSAGRRQLAYFDGCPCSASPVSAAGSGSATQPASPRCFCRRQRSVQLPPLRGELACGFSLTQKEQLPV